MQKHLLFALALGCSGPKTPAPATALGSAASATSGSPSAHAAAVAKVATLREAAGKQPLLQPWTGPYGGVPPWELATPAAFGPAFETGLALLSAEVEAIVTSPDAPTFENTIAAMEDAGRHEDRAETLFYVMTSSMNSPEIQKVDEEWSPKFSAAYDAITFNEALFARVAAVHAMREQLSPEQRRLTEIRYDGMINAGAQLNEAQKAELGKINQDLASLFTEFGNKVLADEDTWTLITDKRDLVGLSPSLIASYRAAAEERKLIPAGGDAWAVVNTRSSVDPFLAAAKNRSLREIVWKAFKQRGDNGNANDTNATIARIVDLRAKRAALLGYPTHAHRRMYNSMAKDPAKAQELMMSVWPAAVARVKEEVADMAPLLRKDKIKGAFEPWDYLYYAEKVRKAKFNLDQEELKPYFELNNMINAAFYMAERLYDLSFVEITGQVPVFYPDMRVWEVKDKSTGAHRGLFYGDYFARKGKRSGAWASSYRNHETFTGKEIKTITSNNNNFVRGAAGEPVLISLDDAQTLFHEFGHAIHSLVSDVNYPSLGNTPRDFVEYPSQVHEMWVMTRDILDRYALHYKTKAKMPAKLLKKVEASRKFNQGYTTVEYLSSALVDMAIHTSKEPVTDPKAFESTTLAAIGAPREVAMRHRLPQFNHLFTSDSYSAGYYSYLWSEVMDADTREAFMEAGDVFDPATAKKMRQFILAPGNTTDRAEAYRSFRGRDPDVKALLKKRGFPTK